ncbi:unnamed protein product, partial [Oppiella nova]
MGYRAQHYEGTSPVLTVADPNLVKRILVTDYQAFPDKPRFEFGHVLDTGLSNASGNAWRRQR